MRNLLIGLLFTSCTNSTNLNNLAFQHFPLENKVQRVDTAKTKPYTVTAKPYIFEKTYFEGTEVKVNDTVLLKFYAVNIGKVKLETGKIVACDPVMTYDQQPFITQFPVGEFPVQLAVAKVNDNQNELVGFSRILFSNEPVVNWEFALKDGQTPISIFGDSMYFYPVDGGYGQFIDESSFNKLKRLDEAGQTDITDNLFAELDKHTHQSWQFANTQYKDINIVAFTSGFGDGRYPTYIGFDKNGKPCRLLTDFGLVDWLEK